MADQSKELKHYIETLIFQYKQMTKIWDTGSTMEAWHQGYVSALEDIYTHMKRIQHKEQD